MSKKHQTMLNEPEEMPGKKNEPEIKRPADPETPGVPEETPGEIPDEIPPEIK